MNEKLIKSGLESLGICGSEANLNIQYHSSSLFSLYRVEHNGKYYAAKIMESFQMAETEAMGLRAIAETGCKTPECFGTYAESGQAILIMEFLETGSFRNQKQDILKNLIRLYKKPAKHWGFKRSNFIGTLPQKNELYDNFLDFYLDSRINPQLDLAIRSKKLHRSLRPELEKMIKKRAEEWGLNEQTPRLIHGDLWSGNVLTGPDGVFLIDPSIALANPEQDLAMLELFGSPLGISEYNIICEEIKSPPGFAERILFWQLYPLLVHVNIFGGSYVSSVERVLRTYW